MFVSWAQNYEDLYLHRCFAERPTGTWIDVGAWLPVVDSVTHHFSLAGWSGVNIEPIPGYFQELAAARPRDVNLQVALGSAPGRCVLHHVPGTGLSSSSAAHAWSGATTRGVVVDEIEVEVTTLDHVWDAHVTSGVEFLKIDVEGAEDDVLAGLDLARHRPEVIVIESNLPDSMEQSYAHWEPRVVGSGYRFALYDGLNRWYAAEEHPEHLDRLAAPLNTADDVIRSRHLALVHAAEADAAALRAECRRLAEELVGARAELDRTRSTVSWRVTAPLRAVRRRSLG